MTVPTDELPASIVLSVIITESPISNCCVSSGIRIFKDNRKTTNVSDYSSVSLSSAYPNRYPNKTNRADPPPSRNSWGLSNVHANAITTMLAPNATRQRALIIDVIAFTLPRFKRLVTSPEYTLARYPRP